MQKNRISKKEIAKIIGFVMLAGVVLMYSSLVLNFKTGFDGYNRYLVNEYNAMEKDSLDVLFVGSSATDRFWIPALAWKESGFTSFDLCSNGCPTSILPGLIEEGTKNQTPEVVVIELRGVRKSVKLFEERRLKWITNNFVTGKAKKKTVKTIFHLSEKYLGDESTIDTSDKSYLSKYINTHNFWKSDIELEDFYKLFPKSEEKGYDTGSGTIWKTSDAVRPTFTNKKYDLGEFEKESLDILLDCCDEYDGEVLFVCTPFSTSIENYGYLNAAAEYVTERGYKVLNLNSEETINKYNYIFNEDFYNPNHTNVRGAIKTTRAITDYLKANYELLDHREDSDYSEEWDNLYEKFVDSIKERRPEWLDLLK